MKPAKLKLVPARATKSIELSNKLSLRDFQILRTIGVGSFAKVKLVKKRGTSDVYVIKCMDKADIVKKRQISNVNNELAFLRACSHPNIARYHGSFQTKSHMFVVLEFVAGGELYSYIRSRQVLDVTSARVYLAQVICALSYVHTQGFVYRDLKPENILISQTGSLKLVDFGFVKKLELGKKTRSLCGTPEYMAPEIVSGIGHDFAADWWSVGILLHEMLVGHTPFTDNSPFDVYNKILSLNPTYPAGLDSDAASLMAQLLAKNPSHRLTEEGIKAHPFFIDVQWAKLNILPPPHLPQLQNASDTSAFIFYPDG